MRTEAKRVARKAESSPAFRGLARAGYVANGLVHALTGVIVLVVAFGGDAASDQTGAFRAIAAVPAGFAALWALAVALWALAAYHAADGLLARKVDDDLAGTARKWGRRAAAWGQTAVFAALGVIAAAVAIGARPDAEQTAEYASRGILSFPGGELILGAIGLGVGIGGIAFVAMGARRSFDDKIDLPRGWLGTAISALGVVGFVAKGLALVVVGAIVLLAAVRVDPETAGGLDGAIRAIVDLPVGEWMAGLVGAGLLAYAVFCVFRGRYARL